MKPIVEDKFTTQGSIDGETKKFGFDPNSLAHLQTVLSKLYEYPEAAVLRELSVNAYDAQIEAGYVGPIEVTTPNALNPTLTIADHGVGMSIDDLHNVYTMYGASTKRDSDKVVGMLGVGSKSPLAITSQFNITTIKDGVKVAAMVRKDESGIGELVIIDTSSTDEPSGTTIKVPTSGCGVAWNSIAQYIFKFWEPGTVLVDGAEPSHADVIKVDDDLSLVSGTHDYLIMGNIAYPIRNQTGFFETSYYRDYPVLAIRVPIGSVHFAPSRESLEYTKTTVEFIKSLEDVVKDKLRKFFSEKFESIDKASEALKEYSKWRRTYRLNKFVPDGWRGAPFPERTNLQGYEWNKKYKRGRSHFTSYTYRDDMYFEETFLIRGYDKSDSPTQTMKRKVVQYCEENGLSTRVKFIFLKSIDDPNGWFDDVPGVEFEDIKAVKLPRKASTKKVSTSTKTSDWEALSKDGLVTSIDSSDIPSEYYYTTTADYDNLQLSELAVLARHIGATIIVSSRNRWGRLLREHPGGEPVKVMLTMISESFEFTEEERMHLGASVPQILRDMYNKFGSKFDSMIDDKALVAAVKASCKTLKTDNLRLRNILSRFGWHFSVDRERYGDDYKLLNCIYKAGREEMLHIADYINSVYAKNQLNSDEE